MDAKKNSLSVTLGELSSIIKRGLGVTEFNAWVFQGNPNFYDLEKYIQSSRQIYWNTPNRNRAKIAIGDPVIIWRSTIDRGAIAVGYVNELPTKAAEVLHPEVLGREFWVEHEVVKEEEWKTGIQLAGDIRVSSAQGMVTHEQFMQHPLLQKSQIIQNPRGTIFRLSQTEFQAFEKLWRSSSFLRDACSFWWVNHKQTRRQEVEGGYIWSPTSKKNGAFNQTYENLRLVQPGDIVFSYADGQIKAIGRAQAGYENAPKPSEFGSVGDVWDQSGWRVPIVWEELENPVRPKSHLTAIAPLLPTKHSPIRAANGDGIQSCYLAGISESLGNLLLELAGRDSLSTGESEIESEEDRQVQLVLASNISQTEKEQIVKARRGQGLFRRRVAQVESVCRLTGVSDPRFLVASHIKPWRVSNNEERLAGHNGLLLSPHVDLLFDKGYISFKDDGAMLVSQRAAAVLRAWQLPLTESARPFTPEQKVFLEYHRGHIFKE
ncbi:HNH endonuclease [Alcaligenes faecalis]|uniref:HNH endonuclease n=1 Tax=Alcaligenes faecalis TaxID=511 RepID=UPI00129393AC|nr:HNH endonuclease [Alcaligenes faecalis]QFY77782.1 HNH endonuclease [Alcaligenes faecalis]